MFISTAEGGLINASHIVSVSELVHGLGCTVTFTDGHKKRLLLTVSDLEELAGTIVPAPPGYMVFEICIPSVAEAAEGLLCLDPRPVIAFRVTDAASCPVPVTAAGAVSTSSGWTYVVRGPEGPWVGPDGDYANAEGFKAVCERRLADAVARHSHPTA